VLHSGGVKARKKMRQEGHAGERQHRFRRTKSQWLQTGALTTDEDDRLHRLVAAYSLCATARA
jgi:hypothetical protein